MEEARKTIVEIPLALIISAMVAMAGAIAAMGIYFAMTRKADKRDAKDSLMMMTDVLLKNSESNIALSNSIDRSRDQQERISEETAKLLHSLTEKVIEIKNGKR